MKRGRTICNELKKVRRRIADENGIALETPECTHQGPCPGTCPRCEAEVRYLERELARRLAMGKVATVAGLTLGLAAGTTAQAQAPVRKEAPRAEVRQSERLSRVTGTVVDGRTTEPLPFCNVAFVHTDRARPFTKFAVTDFDGRFTIDLPDGEYTMRVASVGYKSVEKTVTVSGAARLDDLMLEMTATVLGGIEALICGMPDGDGPWVIGTDAPMQKMEIEGVQVIVR